MRQALEPIVYEGGVDLVFNGCAAAAAAAAGACMPACPLILGLAWPGYVCSRHTGKWDECVSLSS